MSDIVCTSDADARRGTVGVSDTAGRHALGAAEEVGLDADVRHLHDDRALAVAYAELAAALRAEEVGAR